MLRFIAQRLLAAFVTIWIATVAVTLLIHLVPGDPVRIMYATFQSTPEQIEATRRALGLDQPIHIQYFMISAASSRANSGAPSSATSRSSTCCSPASRRP